MKYDLTYLSYGAGVQSSALAILCATGKLGAPRPDCAIFSDTQSELPHTYEMLDRMRDYLSGFGIPVYTVTAGDLEDDATVMVKTKAPTAKHKTRRKVMLPMFTTGTDGGAGFTTRQCTRDYKIFPINRKVRELLGGSTRGKGARGLIGISTDEAVRMKPSRFKWCTHEWPLIDAGLRREACREIVTDAGFPIPQRSACYYCPFHSDREWQDMKDNHPEYLAKAVELERKILATQAEGTNKMYLHASRKPLDEVVFSNEDQMDLFGNECEGMCGL